MRRVNRFGMIAAIAVFAVAAPAMAGNITVGRFYTEIAKAKHMVVVDASSAEAGLRGAGIKLPQLSLNKDLTEGDVTAISTALGLAVTTNRPSELVSESQMNTFMSSFGGQLGAGTIQVGDEQTNAPAQPLDDEHGAKGKKKGHNKSTTEPM